MFVTHDHGWAQDQAGMFFRGLAVPAYPVSPPLSFGAWACHASADVTALDVNMRQLTSTVAHCDLRKWHTCCGARYSSFSTQEALRTSTV